MGRRNVLEDEKAVLGHTVVTNSSLHVECHDPYLS